MKSKASKRRVHKLSKQLRSERTAEDRDDFGKSGKKLKRQYHRVSRKATRQELRDYEY